MGKFKFINELKEELKSLPSVTVVKVIKSSDETNKKRIYARRSYHGGIR